MQTYLLKNQSRDVCNTVAYSAWPKSGVTAVSGANSIILGLNHIQAMA